MLSTITYRTIKISTVFIKEQLKEPTAFFWTILSPTALFYLLNYSKGITPPYQANYMEATSWFYHYISSSVAFFGLSFYIIARRESGFTRSFIYTLEARTIFLLGQFLAYSSISVFYCLAFYLLTRPAFSAYSISEATFIVGRFYLCFLLFSIPGLLLTLPPLTFQNANTTFSIISFSMLTLGIYSANITPSTSYSLYNINPLAMAYNIILNGTQSNLPHLIFILTLFPITFLLTLRFLRVNPVWSRY